MNNIKLDKYEKEIEENSDKFEPISGKKRKAIDNIIDTSTKKKSVNLRLNEQDIKMLKEQAKRSGIPYQTLISSILHKYLTNQLIEENSILKVLKLLR